MSGKPASEPANLSTRACKCSGRIGSLFVVETDLAENLFQPSKTALTKLLSHGLRTAHDLWKKLML